jgi:hypothetical protein
MSVENFFSATLQPGETFTLTVWGMDFNWFIDWQVNPSLNQGFNFGAVQIDSIEAVVDPEGNFGGPLHYRLHLRNTGDYPVMFDAVAQWQTY